MKARYKESEVKKLVAAFNDGDLVNWLADYNIIQMVAGQKTSHNLGGGFLECVEGSLKSSWRSRLRFSIGRLMMKRTRGSQAP